MSRPNIFQVALPPDHAAQLKRNAVTLGLKPATYARTLIMQALDQQPPPKKAKRS